MSLATSLLCLSTFLPAPQGNDLKLPPRQSSAAEASLKRPLSEVERFRRDVDALSSQPARAELMLQEMGLAFPAIEPLIIEVARTARAKEMGDLMAVARRFGTAKVAEELRFQLLARPLGSATRTVVDAMVFLMGPERDRDDKLDEKSALQDCIRGRLAGVRRPATEAFAALATEQDLDFAMALSSDQGLDLQLRGVDLLRAIGNDAATARLIKLLSKGPALAGHACKTLILMGEPVVAPLLELLSGPPIDRGYCYAAFALAEIGAASGRQLLQPEHKVKLKPQLRSGEPLTRSLAAIALSDLAYHAAPAAGAAAPDVAIGDVLLDLVDSRVFVPNLDLLRRPAEQRLMRMTGRVAQANEGLSWREWWQLRRSGFVGLRAAVAVDESNADTAVVTMRQEGKVMRVLAEGLADVAPLPDALEIVLDKERMLALVRDLEALGFGNPEALRFEGALPVVRTIELQVGGARAQAGMPAVDHLGFDGLVARIEAEVESELWQFYRHPQNEPDRAAWWRAEARWLGAHPDPTERGRRFGRRVFTNWAALSPWLRGRALGHLFARADRGQLFDETDGERILAIVGATEGLTEMEQSLLELAAGVPGDQIWPKCVSVAASVPGGGRDAVRAVFAVLGPDAVLSALDDERAVVRRVAIDEAVISRDLRAGPRLVAMMQSGDESTEVRRAAVLAAGQLRLAAAQEPLVSLIIAETTDPLMRRDCLHALGRCGGDKAYAVLDRALHAPVREDREAALKGLGELRDPRAAHTLAEIAVIAHGQELGNLARFYLGRMGALLAVPALRSQLDTVRDAAVRVELVLLLGAYQDPQNVTELMDLLRSRERSTLAADALMATTGFNLLEHQDRWIAMDDWWRANRSRPQWQWLLDALRATETPTVLRAEMFATGSQQAVPELARLLSELREPRLYVLTAAVLRAVTREDFGVVTLQTPPEARAGIAARYRMLVDTRQAARGRK